MLPLQEVPEGVATMRPPLPPPLPPQPRPHGHERTWSATKPLRFGGMSCGRHSVAASITQTQTERPGSNGISTPDLSKRVMA